MKTSINNALPDLKNTLESATDVVIIAIDEKGLINFFNKGAEKILGYEAQEIIGKDVSIIHTVPEIEGFCRKVNGYPHFKSVLEIFHAISFEPGFKDQVWNLRKKNGRTIKATYRVSTINDGYGSINGYLVFITELLEENDKVELQNQEKNIKCFINNLREVVFHTDRKGNISFLNSAWEDITGYSIENTVGRKFIDLIHDKEKTLLEVNLNKILVGKKKIERSEQRILTKNGRLIWVELYIQAFLDEKERVQGVIGSINNITDRKSAENSLQSTLTRLSTIIQYMQEGILAEDQDRTIVLVNEKLCKVFDLIIPPEYLKGTSSKIFWDQILELVKDKDNFLVRIETLIAEGEPVLNEEIFLTDGRILERDYIPVFSETKYNGHLWQYRDITKRKKQEKELVTAKENAIKSVKAKDMFLSTMSHEIRTPLNAVIGMTHILLEENPKQEQIENLKTLKFSAENLMVLINDILDYNKIDAGQITFETIDFSVRDLANGIKQSLNFRADEKGVELNLNIDHSVPEVLLGDPVRLAQIINNLVSNAIKFTEKGHVKINIVNLSNDKENAEIKFEVSDTGIGIPSDKLEYIFYSFTQASYDITRKFGGTGLGLAITKRLIKMQGGDIKVESELGKGSKFYFTLKYKVGVNEPNSKNLNLFGQIIFKSLKGTRLLLVEDSSINRLVATKFLSKWDVEIDYAENGIDAVSKVKENTYDLVLMDLQMPEMDGYEATEAIRNLAEIYYRELPIIALTASAMLDVKEQVFSAGMNDYLTKPFNPNELYLKILKYSNH